MIIKRGDQWCLMTKDGSRTLGCHDSEEKAKAQERAIEANRNSRHLHLAGALSGKVRTAQLHGQEHLVVPVVALVEGVIHAVNAPGPELVLATELEKTVNTWNGRPTVMGHPLKNGTWVSANDPEILEKWAFGLLFNSAVENKRLLLESWLNVAQAAKQGVDAQRVLERARAAEAIEISVGTWAIFEQVSGVYNGTRYAAIWRDITADHLAMLPEGERGACSIAMGCGAVRAAAAVHLVTAQGIQIEEATVADDKKPKQSLKDRLLAFLSTAEDEPVRAASDHECGCKRPATNQGAGDMDKKARIKALRESTHFPLKGLNAEATEAFLDKLTEDELKKLEEETAATKKAADDKATADRQAAEKKAADDKAAADKKATDEAATRAASEKKLTPEEQKKQWLDGAPPEVRAMIARHEAADAARRAQLVTSLKTASEGIYTEDDLKAMPMEQLENLVKFAAKAKPEVDYSVLGGPRANTEEKGKVPPPINFVDHVRAASAKK